MHVAEAGEGYPVVMCHGFRNCGTRGAIRCARWRAPVCARSRPTSALRRHGGPSRSRLYPARDRADLVGMLDAMGNRKCVVVGHDWGGFVVNAA